MYLGKSCSSQFHVKKSGTLRVGTLYEYRHIESPQIVDGGEGVFEIDLQIKGPVAVECKWFNVINSGIVQFGRDEDSPRYLGSFSAAVHDLDMAGFDGDKVLLNYYSASIRRESLNGFIFCMSLCGTKSELESIFPDYDAYWFIHKDMHLEFGRAVALGIIRKIIESHKAGDFIVDRSIDIDDFSVHVTAEPVIYVDRHVFIDGTSSISVEEFLSKMRRMHYIKPLNFNQEREFRFHFRIVSKGREFLPVVKNIIIDAGEVIHFLK